MKRLMVYKKGGRIAYKERLHAGERNEGSKRKIS